jgi:hypothetical protein
LCGALYRSGRPKIADALRIASTFDMIGIDRARFTPIVLKKSFFADD